MREREIERGRKEGRKKEGKKGRREERKKVFGTWLAASRHSLPPLFKFCGHMAKTVHFCPPFTCVILIIELLDLIYQETLAVPL